MVASSAQGRRRTLLLTWLINQHITARSAYFPVSTLWAGIAIAVQAGLPAAHPC
jgi:hypothetical protein